MATNGDQEASERKRRRIVAYSVIAFLFAIAVVLTAPMTTCSSYRQRAIEAAPLSDLRNLATCQAAHYVDKEVYAASVKEFQGDCSNYQPNLNVVIRVVSAGKGHYKMEAYHLKGEYLYEITGGPHRDIIIKYEWKNQTKGTGIVM